MTITELGRIADQYRNDGYVVVVRPRGDDLPGFLQGKAIDLMATRGDEHVVVQARRHRTDVMQDGSLSYLAAEVNAHPGWRMDFVVTGSTEAADDVHPGASEPPIAEIRALLKGADALLQSGQIGGACLVAWSAVEAALRAAARSQGIALENRMPRFVLETLTVEGLLSQDQFDRLNAARRLRNAAAHGLSIDNLNAELVEGLIATANELLELQPVGT